MYLMLGDLKLLNHLKGKRASKKENPEVSIKVNINNVNVKLIKPEALLAILNCCFLFLIHRSVDACICDLSSYFLYCFR